TPESMRKALSRTLNIQEDQIEVLDFSRYPVPSGQVEFPKSGLGKPSQAAPEAPVLWRGRLIYDKGRSVPIWAKVRILVETRVITATVDIERGQIIRAGDVTTVVKK